MESGSTHSFVPSVSVSSVSVSGSAGLIKSQLGLSSVTFCFLGAGSDAVEGPGKLDLR